MQFCVVVDEPSTAMVTEVSASWAMGSRARGSMFVVPRVMLWTEFPLSTSTILTVVVSPGLSAPTCVLLKHG